MIFSTLLSCAIIAFLYYYVIHLARYRRLINLIPGPPMLPIFGDALNLYHLSHEALWNLLMLRYKRYNPIFKLWYFTISYVSLSHPNDIQRILNSTKNNTKGMVYQLFQPWLRNGLLISEGTKWQERRKILTPTFHFNILKRFFEIMLEESNHMTKTLKDMKDPTVQDLVSFISHHTLNIISESAMGISMRNVDISEQEDYRNAIYNIGKLISSRFVRPWYYNNIIFSMTSMYKKQVKCLKILHGFTNKLIKERRQYHKSTGGQYLNFESNVDDDAMIGVQKKRLAMLDLLIMTSNNNQMSDLDIREEVDTFMFEGHDTVAMALTFTILLLAEHKNIQDHVRNEVNDVMKENGGQLTMTALQNLPYMERCIKESIRLYPSVYFITRRLEEDVMLHGYVVPAGSQVHLDIYNLHRNPEFWPNPEVFDPDRFLPELVQDRHPFAYLPFSAGSRNCIGQRFAMMELKTAIGTLVHNFYLEPVDYLKDARFYIDIILRSLHPLRVRFVPIQSRS